MSIEQKRRIEELEKLLNEAQTRQSVAWVGSRLRAVLAKQLAATPYEQWPGWAEQMVADARREVEDGEDLEEILYDWFRLELDYIYDLMGY